MDEWKEKAKNRRDFRQTPDDESDYIPGAKPKKHTQKDFILEEFMQKNEIFGYESGWHKKGSYKKLPDAEKAADHRMKEPSYLNYLDKSILGSDSKNHPALRIVRKDGTVVKEYPGIKD